MLSLAKSFIRYLQLPPQARMERGLDVSGVLARDPGVERAIDEGVAWLCRAQDHSASADGGVARHYSLLSGWGPSYPETTGYIIFTMLAYAKLRNDQTARERAKKMVDWLVSIQFSDGGFQSGSIGPGRIIPVTFNTGQILLGLACAVREFGDQYRKPMRKAADWLVKTQDGDGCWRLHPTPCATSGEKTYETHVAWGLLEAARIESNKSYADAALANVRWALRWQRENGWFEKCCLSDPTRPLTHTLGYALRGVIEAYRFSKDESFLHASRKTADGLLTTIQNNGFLPGRLNPNWTGAVRWNCLTGSAQIAHCWLMLYRYTGDIRYRNAAYAANAYVRRTLKVSGPPETRGAIKGSFPVNGEYGRYQYLNWACKFFIDSNMLERTTRNESVTAH